jgi:hypothetical protein
VLLNSADSARFTIPTCTWETQRNASTVSDEILVSACPDKVMTLAGNETAVLQCQSALAVRTARVTAEDEAGEADGMETRQSHVGELWEDTHTGCILFLLSRCRRAETSVCVNFPVTADAGNG